MIYLDLKKKLMNKKNPKFYNYLIIISTLFSIITFILITINNLSIDNRFKKIQDCLSQNFYFNITKIQTSNLYIILSEFLLFKNQFGLKSNSNNCIGNCTESYIKSFKAMIEDLRSRLSKVLDYDKDFKNIIFTKFTFSDNVSDTFSEINPKDSYTLLYCILSDSLMISDFLRDYINGNSTFDNIINRILLYSYEYTFSEKIGYGFNGESKIKKLNETKFNMSFLYIILNILFFCIAFTFASIIIVNKYKREYYYLSNIIDFQSENFTKYLNYLGELKRQLKNDTNEKEDNSVNENLTKIDNELKKTKIVFDKSKSKDNKIKESESSNKKYQNKNNDKKKLKINKVIFQKQEKKKIMSKYFLRQNIFSAYKICSVFIFSMLYYLLIRFLY